MTCSHPTIDHSTRLIEGRTVLRCRTCNSFAIKGLNQWVAGGSGYQDRLKALYTPEAEQKLDWEAERDRQARTSRIEDPRWEIVST